MTIIEKCSKCGKAIIISYTSQRINGIEIFPNPIEYLRRNPTKLCKCKGSKICTLL